MEIIVIIALTGLIIVCLAQVYILLQLNILYKSKDLTEYSLFNTKPASEEPIPEEVEVERYS